MKVCIQTREEIAERSKKCNQKILALGNETRQQIVATLLLSDHVGLRVGEIAKGTHLSHHLRILREAKIVSMYRKGTMNFYYLDAGDHEWEELSDLFRDISVIYRKPVSAGYPQNTHEEKEND